MSEHHHLRRRVEAAHGVERIDPFADRSRRHAANGIEIREGTENVIAGKQRPLLGKPNKEVVVSLTGSGLKLEFDSTDLECRPRIEQRGREADWGPPLAAEAVRRPDRVGGHLLKWQCGPKLLGAADK